jgi:hypothetical protein
MLTHYQKILRLAIMAASAINALIKVAKLNREDHETDDSHARLVALTSALAALTDQQQTTMIDALRRASFGAAKREAEDTAARDLLARRGPIAAMADAEAAGQAATTKKAKKAARLRKSLLKVKAKALKTTACKARASQT